MQQEGIKVASSDVGGTYARRLHFFPDTGRAMIRKLVRQEDMVILDKEREYQNKIKEKILIPQEAEVELF